MLFDQCFGLPESQEICASPTDTLAGIGKEQGVEVFQLYQ